LRFALFYHSLVSDWNHGNAHFLRGIATELIELGLEILIYEPADGWSASNLRQQHGEGPFRAFHAAYPRLRSRLYDPLSIDLDAALDGVDVVIVHEWNDPAIVARIGRYRARTRSCKVLFHDTHHRAISAPRQMQAYDLSEYDAVLAFGEVLRQHYERRGLRAFTWHEAADTRIFHPLPATKSLDLVWVGNWGDGERTAQLMELLVNPARELGLRARAHGVRYPEDALGALREAGIRYAGWIANFEVPAVFAQAAVTVHVHRRYYSEQLPGIPTIRVFEALACGIPLVCAPWDDTEGLFHPGQDYLVARDGPQMREHLRRLRRDRGLARELAEHGLRAIRARHTCAHRVSELLAICRELGSSSRESDVLTGRTAQAGPSPAAAMRAARLS